MIDKKGLEIKLLSGNLESLNSIDSFNTYLWGVCFMPGAWLSATAARMAKMKLHGVAYSLMGKGDFT